jgi:dTDP-4-dehydrorhamnose reductase
MSIVVNAAPAQPEAGLALWGGHECTVNRVGDQWFDQTERSGHGQRLDDLARFAELGISALRYPVLWERVSPNTPDERDFSWADTRLSELRRLGIRPIVTLIHHGSGPRYTSLIEDSFAPGLAAHAAATAARYPWVRDWTPVNEPLTTARFSALYGFWFPHLQDERLFWLALLNQIDATRLAMKAIRAVNPEARLIQTDDLGFCHASEPLQHEANYQNQRRWMGWDLLCGHVVPGHALWQRLADHGFESRLHTIAADPCPPDIIGINHYLSSERLIDHRIDDHPHRSVADRKPGDSAGMALVDVDAIRHRRAGVLGLPALLRQAWERYRIPLAVTECHNAATREEQVRWFVEGWQQAQQLRREGVDLRAVTAWALLGSYDWNCMVTRIAHHYEIGVFDVRMGAPRPTLLASVMRDLAKGRKPDAPILGVPGWWRRETRFIDAKLPGQRQFEVSWPTTQTPHSPHATHAQQDGTPDRPSPLLIVTDNRPLSHLACLHCEWRGIYYLPVSKQRADAILMQDAAERPWACLDARDPENLCAPVHRVGGTAPWRPVLKASSLARRCGELGIACAVFTNAYSPPRAEDAGLKLMTVRTGSVYLPWDDHCRPVRLLSALDRGECVHADTTSAWDSVYGPDLVDQVLDLLLDGMHGPVTFVPREQWSEFEFAQRLASVAGKDAALVQPAGPPDQRGDAPSIKNPSLLPPAEITMERFIRDARRARDERAVGEDVERVVGRRGDDGMRGDV